MTRSLYDQILPPYSTRTDCLPQLDQMFDDIRSAYFPDWDPERSWSVEACPEGMVGGRDELSCCDPEARVFRVHDAYASWGGHVLRRMLIHTICHAVGGPEHDDAWRRPIIEAAERASHLGDALLASSLLENSWPQHSVSDEELMRLQIVALVASNPDASFADVMAMVADLIQEDPVDLAASFPMSAVCFETAKAAFPSEATLRSELRTARNSLGD